MPKTAIVAPAISPEQIPTDPISFFCSVLRDENASSKERRYAAEQLLPYWHPELAKIGPLLWKFLTKPVSKA